MVCLQTSVLQHLAVSLFIHLAIFLAVIIVISSQSSKYERLNALTRKYCDERLKQDSSGWPLYLAFCTSLQLDPPSSNQIFQEFIYNGTTARLYFKSEVILLLKKNAGNMKVQITPISGSLAEKKGWHSAGPVIDIMVVGETSNIKLVGLPHVLSHEAPTSEIKVFYEHSETNKTDQFDVLRLLKYHVFYKPSRQFSPREPGTNNSGNLAIMEIDIPVFLKGDQPEMVQLAPIPQNEASLTKVRNWLESDGFQLESLESPCRYPYDNDPLGFLNKPFYLKNDYIQLTVNPTRNIRIVDPFDSINRSRIHVTQSEQVKYDGEFFYLSLMSQRKEKICEAIKIKLSLSLSLWKTDKKVRLLCTFVASFLSILLGLSLEGFICNNLQEKFGTNCLEKIVLCTFLLALASFFVLLICVDYPSGTINIVMSSSFFFILSIMLRMAYFLCYCYQEAINELLVNPKIHKGGIITLYGVLGGLWYFEHMTMKDVRKLLLLFIPALIWVFKLTPWELLSFIIFGYYIMNGLGFIPDETLIKLVNTYDALIKWYYFPYHVIPFTVCFLLLVLTNTDRLIQLYFYIKTCIDAIRFH